MPRPKNGPKRRRQLATAFGAVLAEHGLGGATLARAAVVAGVAPALFHHHFDDREDVVRELVDQLFGGFAETLESPPAAHRKAADRQRAAMGRLEKYIDEALSLRGRAHTTIPRIWVGVFAEAIRSGSVRKHVQRKLRRELARLTADCSAAGIDEERSAEALAAGIVATILGALVFGSLMPTRARGFAAPFLRGALAHHVHAAGERGNPAR